MKIKKIILGLCLFYSANLFAFCIHNDTDESVHWRIYGPSAIFFYGKVKPHKKVCKKYNRHVRLYLYFRHTYDILYPFSPRYRDNVCPALLYRPTTPKTEIRISPNGAYYNCSASNLGAAS